MALQLLARVASAHPAAGRTLLQLGAEGVLRALRPRRTADLYHLIDTALNHVVATPAAGAAVVGGHMAIYKMGI